MAVPMFHPADEHFENVLTSVAEEGFHLVQIETSEGQLVWEWRRGNDPKPQFVNRRVALHFMDDLLRRMHASTTDRTPSSDLRSIRAMSHKAQQTGSGSQRQSNGDPGVSAAR